MRQNSESTRIARLREFGILDTPKDRLFEALVKQALELFPGTSIAAISLIDTDRQWFKAILGIDAKETPRSDSFCSHTIQTSGVMVVEDATHDERFASGPLVTGAPGIRFYAGAKLIDGLGALCVIGTDPRKARPGEVNKLVKLARCVDIQLLAHGTAHQLASSG